FFVVLTNDVAHVLTQVTFDALSELLYPFDIRLLHPPRPVRRVGWPRRKAFDPLFDLEIPRDVGYEILDARERAHGLDRDWCLEIEITEARHAQQSRLPLTSAEHEPH